MEEKTFQRRKLDEQPVLPELLNPVHRRRLMNAYQRIEREYQRRKPAG